MIGGTSLFWCYTALFAGAMLNESLHDVEEEIATIEKRIFQLGQRKDLDQTRLSELTKKLESLLS